MQQVGSRSPSIVTQAGSGVGSNPTPMPDYRTHAVAVASPGAVAPEDTRVLGAFLRDIITCAW